MELIAGEGEEEEEGCLGGGGAGGVVVKEGERVRGRTDIAIFPCDPEQIMTPTSIVLQSETRLNRLTFGAFLFCFSDVKRVDSLEIPERRGSAAVEWRRSPQKAAGI